MTETNLEFNSSRSLYQFCRNLDFEDFINGKVWCFKFRYCGVDVIITRGLNQCKFYYQYEYDAHNNYDQVQKLMRLILPKISALVEEKAISRL